MDQGKEYDLPSGAKLFVSVSEYERVMALHDAFAAELRGRGIGTLDVVEVQKTLQGEGDEGLNVIVDKLLGMASSKEFKAALFACAEKALYRPDGTEASSLQFKLGTPGFGVFDHQQHATQARGDFYAICRAVVEENLRPFGKAIFSMFKAHMERLAASQKSSTTTV